MLRAVARGTLLVALCVSMVWARVLWSSRIECLDAEARAGAGDLGGAIDHYGRAARLYAPWNPWSKRAFHRLEEQASRYEKANDRAASLSAWRELRSAVLATRSTYTPHHQLLDEANQHIALLSAALESPALDPGADEATRAAWHAARLAHDDAPSVMWSLIAILGFVFFVAAGVGFCFRAIDEEDRLRGGAAVRWGFGVALGMTLFLCGLARA